MFIIKSQCQQYFFLSSPSFITYTYIAYFLCDVGATIVNISKWLKRKFASVDNPPSDGNPRLGICMWIDWSNGRPIGRKGEKEIFK